MPTHQTKPSKGGDHVDRVFCSPSLFCRVKPCNDLVSFEVVVVAAGSNDHPPQWPQKPWCSHEFELSHIAQPPLILTKSLSPLGSQSGCLNSQFLNQLIVHTTEDTHPPSTWFDD
jgi:hypothetical protein